jgi:hypothetical protein
LTNFRNVCSPCHNIFVLKPFGHFGDNPEIFFEILPLVHIKVFRIAADGEDNFGIDVS